MATQTLTRPKKDAYVEEDVGNIMLMEHVNVQVPDQQMAMLFYLVGLGFTRDPHMMVGLENMWVNLGEQQFHLPTNKPNVLRGHMGLVVPSLDALAERLEGVAPKLAGTKFKWSREDGYIAATCPWGNKFRLYEPSPEFGNISVGTAYVQFSAPRGTADGIAAFYDKVIGAISHVEKNDEGKRAVVNMGQYQRLIFQETDNVPEYDGHHIAVYIANFSKPYRWLSERGLVTEEPRNHQYRFVDIVDPKTGELLYQLEHEVRGLHHVQYRRPLVNRMAGQYLEPRRVNGQTVLGTVM
ncbi:MAG TPA: hypothetical protein VJB57_10685 [Dehalococcoidia bacterium]|nr:hypothetical protein [Dehalococcoidia bacterium]